MRRAAAVVAGKEIRDHLRDRRSLFSALVVPVLYPLLVGILFTALASMTASDRPLRIAVLGGDRAPGLVDFLKRYGAETVAASDDYEARIKEGDEDIALVIKPEYATAFREGRTAEVAMVYDGARSRVSSQVSRTARLLRAYAGQVGSLRLVARGVDPSLAGVLDIDDVDLSTKREQGAALLNVIPLMLLMATFMSSMQVTIDTTAGERERGSLEALLITPATRAALVVGKWLAALLTGVAGASIGLAGFAIAVRLIPLEDLGVRASLGPREATVLFAALVPLVTFASALQMLVSAHARTFKEAQTYLTILTLVPTLPGIVMSIVPIKTAAWMSFVPALGQQLLMTEAMRGEGVGLGPLVFPALTSFALAYVCLHLLVRVMSRETTLAS